MSWIAAGAGDMLLGTAQTVTAAKTFNNATFLLGNSANIFSTTLATSATANRTWTIPEISAAGTFAALEGTQTFSGAKTFSAMVFGSSTAVLSFRATTAGSFGISGDGTAIAWRFLHVTPSAGFHDMSYQAWNGTSSIQRFRISANGNNFSTRFYLGADTAGTTRGDAFFHAKADMNNTSASGLYGRFVYFDGNNHTLLSIASTGIEYPTIAFNSAYTKNFGWGGTYSFTNYRTFFVSGGETITDSTGGANGTITNAASFAIAGPPVAGSGITFTNTAISLWVQAGLTRLDGNALIGATGSSVGLYGVTPVARATTGISPSSYTHNASSAIHTDDVFGGYTLRQIAQALINLGILT
jgi:hypothetical protein